MAEHAGNRKMQNQILAMNLLLVALTAVLMLAMALVLSIRQEKQHMEGNLLSLARVLAESKPVLELLKQEEANSEAYLFLDEVLEEIGIDLLVVVDVDEVRRYHYDKSLIGGSYTGTDQKAVLQGAEGYLSRDTGISGDQLRAYAGVYDEGSLLGFVMTGRLMTGIRSLRRQMIVTYAAITVMVALLGVLLSLRLSRRIRKTLHGYEPDVISRLFVQREDILDALEEGVVAVGSAQELLFVNRAAENMLKINRKQLDGVRADEICPGLHTAGVLQSKTPEFNIDMELAGEQMLTDRIPIIEGNRPVGVVVILRSRTELNRMAEDLTGVRHMVDALRANNHEFVNKLHVILGLIQTQRHEEAIRYINQISMLQKEDIHFILERIRDPHVSALLVGKTSYAAERGIRLILDPGSRLESGNGILQAGDFVRLLGNLLDNALDATEETDTDFPDVSVGIYSDEFSLIIVVDDAGCGMDAKVRERVFDMGFSTKGENRGRGLAMVRQIVDANGGEISVDSEPGAGTSITVSFTGTKAEGGVQ